MQLELVERRGLHGWNQPLEGGARMSGIIEHDAVVPVATVGTGNLAAAEQSKAPAVILRRDIMQKRLAGRGNDAWVWLEAATFGKERNPTGRGRINVACAKPPEQVASVLGPVGTQMVAFLNLLIAPERRRWRTL